VAGDGFPEMQPLLSTLDQKGIPIGIIEATLDALERAQAGIILVTDQRFETREDIYYKRHIAVDIPSVYGQLP
jgi:pyruvate,orthophosphate dikinase